MPSPATATGSPRAAASKLTIEEVYAAWDEAQARDAATWPPGFACPRPCSLCCERTPVVPVTAAEARVAARAVRGLPGDLGGRVRARIAAVASQIDVSSGLERARDDSSIAPPPHGVRGACPLLDDGLCSIYAERPLICRAFGFCAEEGGVYMGCDILTGRLRRAGEIALPNLDAARALLVDETVFDGRGDALPSNSTLPEMLERLLALPDLRR